MFGRGILALLVPAGLALALLEPATGRTEQAERVPDAPEALTRGPVHEAYVQPSTSPQQTPAPILREPPAQIEEQPPDQKPEGAVIWVPGYWQWDEDRSDFIWVSGFWRVPPPGREWLPGFYRKVEGGYQWVPGMWTSEHQSELNVLPPPPASVENGPSQPAPADDSVYVPGNWIYRESRYAWRPGYFIAYRPDYVWVPAHYVATPAGFLLVEGYWDYPLARRGLLFAPVAFPGGIVSQPDFAYVPNYVVSAEFLPTALFARPGYGHYYFGDYYGPTHVRSGYVPWVDFRLYRNSPDPFFVQTRIGFGGGAWERGVRTLYAQRSAGLGVLPPRSLAQQNVLIRGNTVNATNVRNVTVLSPLAQVSRQGLPLSSVSLNERVRYQQSGQQIRQRALERRHVERQLVASHSAPLRANDPPRTITLSGSGSHAVRSQATVAPVRTSAVPLTPVPHASHGSDRGALPVRNLPRPEHSPMPPSVRSDVQAIRHEAPAASHAVHNAAVPIHHEVHHSAPVPVPHVAATHPSPVTHSAPPPPRHEVHAAKPAHSKPHKP